MASVLGAIRRNWQILRPPESPKQANALKFGILGAAEIAPMALITPSKTHPEVIIHAVAARDKTRAVAYAKKHGIPNVLDSYDAILNDASVDAVYIPLPNGLHFEWALRALSKGKHVLLEKPSCSNATEAEILFRSPLLTAQPQPVLLEAFHNRFSPAWACLMAQVDQPNVEHVSAEVHIPAMLFNDNNIRFNYDLGGGAMMDLGTYAIAALRGVYGVEPEACDECVVEKIPPPRERCDGSFKIKFRFPGNRVGEIDGGLRTPLMQVRLPTLTVRHRPVTVDGGDGENETTRTRKVVLGNFLLPGNYHFIDVEDETISKNKTTGRVVKKVTHKERKKAYTFSEMGVDRPGETYWPTYRYMLEQFVNKVRGRETTAWVEHEDSVAQMKALDMAYEKSGLGPRPTSNYRPENP